MARAYVAMMDPAVTGQHGDKQTYKVALVLVKDFDLTPDEANPLMMEYNARCKPPWQEGDLRRKLEMADQVPGPRGTKLLGTSQATSPVVPAAVAAAGVGEPYLGYVPDFIQADALQAAPFLRRRDNQGRLRRGRRLIFYGVEWLLIHELKRQTRDTAWIPDVLFAQVVWGARGRPANWLDKLKKVLGQWFARWNRAHSGNPVEMQLDARCCRACPLHGRDAGRHRHFVISVPSPEGNPTTGTIDIDQSFLGALELLRYHDAVDEEWRFHAGRLDASEEDRVGADPKAIADAQKRGRLRWAYLPVLLFGTSSRSGLTHEGVQILKALTRETTRNNRSERPDKANVVIGGKPDMKGPPPFSVCPYLVKGERYVGFNGNGSYRRRGLRGRGYRLVGNSWWGWVGRSGFLRPEEEDEARWKAAGHFLHELERLSVAFGLVVGAWHPQKRKWHSLENMIVLTRTAAGRKWLDLCRVRIYAPEDYPARWRQYFAQRLGFSCIPGDGDEGTVNGHGGAESVTSAADLQCWMRRQGLTDAELAGRMVRSASSIRKYRTGQRAWSPRFEAELAVVVKDLIGRLAGVG
jgi:hypothetical protein